MKPVLYIFLMLLITSFMEVTGQNTTFKVTNRNVSTSNVPNNASFFQTTFPLGKVQNDFDVINLTAVNQDIIIRKTELVLNVISTIDKAMPSYCFGIFCRNADTFADTVPFLPGQTIPLEFDFFEASHPGHSFIKYTVYNKNNVSESVSIYVDYEGVVSINELNAEHYQPFKMFPNPALAFVAISVQLKNASSVDLSIYDVTGKLIYKNQVSDLQAGQNSININTTDFAPGVYSVEINSPQGQLRQKLVIQK